MKKAILAGLGFFLWCSCALSHPHAWIDISVELHFDAEGRVIFLDQTWLFDPFYTAQMVGKGDPMRMEAMMARIFKNLKPYDYFTHIEAAGRSLAVLEARALSARMIDDRLAVRFELPLSQPLAPTLKEPLSYRLFDPTYYIEMLHSQTEDAIRLASAPASCQTKLIAPKPDPQAVIAASALDRGQTAKAGLGKFFAETVEISCSQRSLPKEPSKRYNRE